jgi:hypothetical protein
MYFYRSHFKFWRGKAVVSLCSSVHAALATARNYNGVRKISCSMRIESLEVTRSQSVQQREVMWAMMNGSPITLSAQSSGRLSN